RTGREITLEVWILLREIFRFAHDDQTHDAVPTRHSSYIDTNFTNSHGLSQADRIKVVRFVPIRVIRVPNPTRLLLPRARRGGPLVVRECAAGRTAGWRPFRPCRFL